MADTTPHQLLVSRSSARSAPTPLDGAVVSGNAYVFLGPAHDAIAGAQRVVFHLDGVKVSSERSVAYDLKTTATNGRARPLDTRKLADGEHVVDALVVMASGVTFRYRSVFVVDNAGGVNP